MREGLVALREVLIALWGVFVAWLHQGKGNEPEKVSTPQEKPQVCTHEWGELYVYTRLHSTRECLKCGCEIVLPTPPELAPESQGKRVNREDVAHSQIIDVKGERVD